MKNYTSQLTEPLQKVRDYMLSHHETIAVAESVTSGHIQAALSTASDAAKFYQGGITTYNLGQKARHLLIDPIHADACNCVSEQIAIKMALQVCQLFSSNWGIGITGYAAPVPECNIDTIFCFYAIVYNGSVIHSGKITSDQKDAWDAQQGYALFVLEDLAGQLATKPKRNSLMGQVL
jgi:nicotinamide-nucleotide amidase